MTGHAVDFLPTADALGRHARLDYSAELEILGIEARFQSNSRFVLDIVEEAFGAWRDAARAVAASENVYVRIIVQPGGEGDSCHAPIRHLCPDAIRVIVHSPGSVAISDPARRESVAYVTTALVADRAHFRGAMLEAITFALLAHFDRHPIHAAAITRDGRAVLLAGPSGAGKSTLAYVAHTAAIDVLSEDHVWVQLSPSLRVWGAGGRRVRLSPDAPSHFPEVARVTVPADDDGKSKLVVDLDAAKDGRLRHVADSAVVCVLERGSGSPTLERLEPSAIISALSEQPAPGFDRFPERHTGVVHALAGSGGWRLTLSNDPHAALRLLVRILDES